MLARRERDRETASDGLRRLTMCELVKRDQRDEPTERRGTPRHELPADGGRHDLPLSRARRRRRGSRLTFADLYRCDKAIPAPVEGLDVGRELRVIAQKLAQPADSLGQRSVRDERILPDPIDQILTRHEIACALEQEIQDAEHPWRSRDVVQTTAQELIVRIEGKRPEREGRSAKPWRRRKVCGRHPGNADVSVALRSS